MLLEVISRLLLPVFFSKRNKYNSPQFNSFASSIDSSLPQLPMGHARTQFDMVARKCIRQSRVLLENRPNCRIEHGVIFTERLPNAVCAKLTKEHYAIGFYSTMFIALMANFTYIVNRRSILFGDDVNIKHIERDNSLDYPWGFEPMFDRTLPFREMRMASSSLLYEFMMLSALEFIFNHELTHINMGHLDYRNEVLGAGALSESEEVIDKSYLDPVRIACELEADTMAAAIAITQSLRDEGNKVIREILVDEGFRYDDLVYSIVLLSQVIALSVIGLSSIYDDPRNRGKNVVDALKTWTNYPSAYYRLRNYRNWIRDTPHREIANPRAIFSGKIWNVVERTMARLFQLNPSFRLTMYAFADEYSDKFKLDLDLMQSIQREMEPYRWFTPSPAQGVSALSSFRAVPKAPS